jgi:BolA protein
VSQREAAIEERISQALQPTQLEIINESHLHEGHEGAKDGRGHFRVRIASPLFKGKTLIQRHRLVYEAVGDLMDSDIHALAIEVLG